MSAFNISIEDAPLEEKVSIGSAGDDAHHNDTAEGANEKTLTTSSNDNKIQDTATSINNKDTNKTIQIEDINMNNENIETPKLHINILEFPLNIFFEGVWGVFFCHHQRLTVEYTKPR